MTKHGNFIVPIFKANVTVAVSDEPRKFWNSKAKIFGESESDDWAGLCGWNSGSRFLVVFDSQYFSEALVVHELIHLSMRILQWHSMAVNDETSEIMALLTEYLYERTMKALGPFENATRKSTS